MISRRGFLQVAGSTLVLAGCNPFKLTERLNPAQEMILGGFSDFQMGGKSLGAATISQQSLKHLPIANEIHSALYSTREELRIFLPKLGDHAYAQRKDGLIKVFSPAPGNYFYGHGEIDNDRNILYTTQAAIPKGGSRLTETGSIQMYSLSDLRRIGELPSYGNDPHEMKIFGNIMVVCNGGSNSNIAFIDLETGKLKASYGGVPSHISLRHIVQIDELNYAVATLSHDVAQRPHLYHLHTQHGLSVNKDHEKIKSIHLNEQLLSIVSFNDNIIGTCVKTQTVLVWDRKGNLRGTHSLPLASSAMVSKKLGGVLIGSGHPLVPFHLLKINNNSYTLEMLSWGQGITSSHAKLVEIA